MVAEFSDCRWLPRIDETLVLPTDKATHKSDRHGWQRFKVVDIVYDFRTSTVRVWCKPKHIISEKRDFEKQVQQALDRLEALFVKQRQEKIEREAQLQYEPFISVGDVDEELERLKAQMTI